MATEFKTQVPVFFRFEGHRKLIHVGHLEGAVLKSMGHRLGMECLYSAIYEGGTLEESPLWPECPWFDEAPHDSDASVYTRDTCSQVLASLSEGCVSVVHVWLGLPPDGAEVWHPDAPLLEAHP